MKLKSLLLPVALLCGASFASAQQVVLHDFSAFESPATTVFMGDWAANGDPFGGDATPIAGFSQGAGVYNISGGTNADTAGAFYFFSAPPGDLTGYSLLEVSAGLLAGNTAPTFTVSLFDANNESAFAVFLATTFAGPGLTTYGAELTFSPGFDATTLTSFQITGGVLGGTDALNISLDQLAVTNASPIPEPATYGLFAGLVALAVALARRRRRA